MAKQHPLLAEMAPALSPLSILRALWKRKLIVLAVWIIGAGAGVAYVRTLPLIYRAEALVVVDSQKIPERYVSSTVVSDAQDRLANITLEILTNARLLNLIHEFGLYKDRPLARPDEQSVQLMRKDIEVTTERAFTGRTASFRVSFQGRDPVIAARVANRLAGLFVEENSKKREFQANETSEFIEQQLADAQKKLNQLEAAVSSYKVRHNGELPQQENSLEGTLGRLQVELEANRDAINRSQRERVGLQDQLATAEDAERLIRNTLEQQKRDLERRAIPVTRPLSRVEALQAQLSELRLKYSEDYPDVKRTRMQLEQAKEEEKAAGGPSPQPAAANRGRVDDGGATANSPDLLQAQARITSLNSQLALANQEIARRENEQKRIVGDITSYQSRLGSLPLREQEMAQITRDYEISKANYKSLMDKKINAEMAADMEVRQKSERFSLADPARVPGASANGRTIKVMKAGALIFALLLGLAIAFALELHKGAFLGEWELPPGAVVLARLPFIQIAPNLPSEDGRTAGGKRQRSVLLSRPVDALLGALLVAIAGFFILLGRF